MSRKTEDDKFNGCQSHHASDSGRETSHLSSRSTTSYNTESSFQKGCSFIVHSPRQSDAHEQQRNNSRLSDDYIQREQTILSKHDTSIFPEKPRELFNPLNGLLPERKVLPKTFHVLPAITTPRSLASRLSNSSQLSMVKEKGGNSNCNSPRLADITPVILPPINQVRWNALRQSEDISVYNERVCWDVSSRQNNSSDNCNSCGYRKSPDGYM